MITSFFNLIYPLRCSICGTKLEGRDKRRLCPTCWDKIEWNPPPFCQRCGRSLTKNHTTGICRGCRNVEYYFDRAWSACVYDGTLRECIHLFKYKRKISLLHTLVEVLTSFINRFKIEITKYDLLLPVPLHPAKQREREFNQAQLLTLELAKEFDIIVSSDNLYRKRFTRPMSELTKEEKFKNIEGAFKARFPHQFCQKDILLFDDLFTTGTTASECAKVLKEAGANRVDVLTLARAYKPNL
jgi:ComF family protein